MSNIADSKLLRQFDQPGHPDTFGDLSRRYLDFIYSTAVRNCQDDAMAADVTQAVLIVLARRAGSIRADALPAWLHRVTLYAVKNAKRAERRRRKHERAAAIQRPEVVMPADSPDESQAIDLLLDSAIASLPTRDRALVIARYLCGRDLHDVAQLAGTTTTATQKRLERGVARLRDYFRRHGQTIGAAGIPWPKPTAAPATIAHSLSEAAATTHVQTLAGEVMRQMRWMKIGFTFATVLGVAAVVTTVIGVARLAQAQSPSTDQLAAAPTTQQGIAREVFIDGDVPRPGVYKLPDGGLTVGQLFAAAGVSLKVGDHYSTTNNTPTQPQTAPPPANANEVLLRPGDKIRVSAAAPPVPADAKLAPFIDIRWTGDVPEIQLNESVKGTVKGTWYRWIGINERAVSSVIEIYRDQDGDQWRKRMGEDLVQVLNRDGIYVGSNVDLDIQPLDGGPIQNLNHVPMTEENRRSVYAHRVEREN